MRVFYEPKVTLIARPELVKEGIDFLLSEYGMGLGAWQRDAGDSDSEGLCEVMGRLCYGSFGERQGRVGATEYMKNIINAGHGSVLEHANWSFLVSRAGRGYTHQQVRHRAGFAYSQESTHFIRYSSSDPDRSKQEPGACLTGLNGVIAKRALTAMEAAVKDYESVWKDIRASFPKDAKVKKIVSGTARALLPNGLESRIGITANARALRHFCEMRGNPENTLEIRLVACQMLIILLQEAPAIFQGMGVTIDSDGYPRVTSESWKV